MICRIAIRIIHSKHALIKDHSELKIGRDEFHTSSGLALKMMCELAMVFAAVWSRRRVTVDFGTPGRSCCGDALVEVSQCPRAPISMVMRFAG